MACHIWHQYLLDIYEQFQGKIFRRTRSYITSTVNTYFDKDTPAKISGTWRLKINLSNFIFE